MAGGSEESTIAETVTTLHFGVVANPEQAREALAQFCGDLERATGMSIQPKAAESYSALVNGVRQGEIDIAWAPPLVAVELEDQKLASSVAVVQRTQRSGYYCAVFVRASSSIKKPEDLHGARPAWVTRESASGYVVPRWYLRSLGIDLDAAFRDEQFLGSHEAVLEAVLEGRADTGATHVGLDPVTGKLKTAPWLSESAAVGAVRVILLIGPIPGDVLMASTRLSPTAQRQLTAAFLSLRGEIALFEASRFDPVPDGHFTMLRKLSRYSETRS